MFKIWQDCQLFSVTECNLESSSKPVFTSLGFICNCGVLQQGTRGFQAPKSVFLTAEVVLLDMPRLTTLKKAIKHFFLMETFSACLMISKFSFFNSQCCPFCRIMKVKPLFGCFDCPHFKHSERSQRNDWLGSKFSTSKQKMFDVPFTQKMSSIWDNLWIRHFLRVSDQLFEMSLTQWVYKMKNKPFCEKVEDLEILVMQK